MDTLLPTHSGDSPEQLLRDGTSSWLQRLKALVLVLFHRSRRGAVGFLVRVTAIVLAILLLVQLLSPQLAARYRKVLVHGEPAEEVDLRIVVFGSQDFLGSAVDAATDRVTWPEKLCEELNCSSLMSFVPTSEFDLGLTSNRIYGTALQDLQQIAEQSDIIDKPATDWFFVKEQYPVPSQTPDLEQQVQQFLSLQAADQPPHETLWVFSFGTWDVWKLAAMPLETGERVVDSLSAHMFDQAELLYRESLKPQSIAFSDFWASATETEVGELTDPEALEKADERQLESFRVVMPNLLDISLTPGWHARPAPPMPHSSAEQLRNSAVLTERWNSRVRSEMDSWVSKARTKPGGLEDGETAREAADAPNARSPLEPAPSAPGSDQEAPPEPGFESKDVIYAPYPQRLGSQADVASTILGAMTEEEMQRNGASDSKGRGTLPPDDAMRFLDVWTPCAVGPERHACEAPDDHLFFDSFTVGQRAINTTARLTAEDVREKLVKREEEA